MTDLNTPALEAVSINSQVTDADGSKTEDEKPVKIIGEQIGATSLLYSDLATTISDSSLEIASSSREIDETQRNAETTSTAVLSEMGSIPSTALAAEEGVPTPPPSPTTRKTTVRPRSDFFLDTCCLLCYSVDEHLRIKWLNHSSSNCS